MLKPVKEINKKDFDLNDLDTCGMTPFMNACINGHNDVVKFLLCIVPKLSILTEINQQNLTLN